MMKAAAWITALHVDTEGLTDAVDAALMGVTGSTVRIHADEHGVVVLSIPEFFTALIE